MIRLLFMIPLCALASSQATAQNEASQILLALSEDERNAAVTGLLRESNATGSSAPYLRALNWDWMNGRRYATTEIRTRLLSRRN